MNEVGDEFHNVLFFAEQIMLLLGKRILSHPSINTFIHVINANETKLLKLSKLIQIIVKFDNKTHHSIGL